MKAYIFDLDGTLLDSMGVWLSIDIEFLKKRGLIVPDDYAAKVSSMNFPEAAAYTIKRFELPDSVECLIHEWSNMAVFAYGNTIQMKPYAKEYLSALREHGAKLAIATSSTPELYEPALVNHGIYDWFNVICNAEEVDCGKSHPDIFLLAAKKLNVSPSDCVVYEDILTAVKSAKSIGMTVCAVYDTSSENDWEEIKQLADYAIFDFKDAPLHHL